MNTGGGLGVRLLAVRLLALAAGPLLIGGAVLDALVPVALTVVGLLVAWRLGSGYLRIGFAVAAGTVVLGWVSAAALGLPASPRWTPAGVILGAGLAFNTFAFGWAQQRVAAFLHAGSGYRIVPAAPAGPSWLRAQLPVLRGPDGLSLPHAAGPVAVLLSAGFGLVAAALWRPASDPATSALAGILGVVVTTVSGVWIGALRRLVGTGLPVQRFRRLGSLLGWSVAVTLAGGLLVAVGLSYAGALLAAAPEVWRVPLLYLPALLSFLAWGRIRSIAAAVAAQDRAEAPPYWDWFDPLPPTDVDQGVSAQTRRLRGRKLPDQLGY